MSEIKRLKYFVDGQWLDSKTEKYMPVYNPSTGEVIAETTNLPNFNKQNIKF